MPNHLAAAERARWLAELAGELDNAVNILPEIILAAGAQSEILELYSRIEAVRSELRALRLSGVQAEQPEIDPKSMQSISETVWAEYR